jgi:hypothetical protein
MPIKLSKKEVDELFLKPSRFRAKKPAHFASEIESLKDGEGLKISKSEWDNISKVGLSTYYRNKYNAKNGNDILDIKKVGDDYLVKKNLNKVSKPTRRRSGKSSN